MAGRHIRYNVAGRYFEYSTTGLEAGPWTILPLVSTTTDPITVASLQIESPAVVLNFKESDGAADAKFWRFLIEAGGFYLQTINDAYSASGPVFDITRSGLNSVTFNINVPLVNLIGGQLRFPTVQVASSDVNTLDDYEEGTFTLTLNSSGGGVPTYANRSGTYTKKGRECSFNGRLTLATLGTLAAGTLTVSGLPFTSLNDGNFGYVPVSIGHFLGLVTNVSWFAGLVFANNTYFDMRHILAAGGNAVGQLTVADITGNFDLLFSGTMQVQ